MARSGTSAWLPKRPEEIPASGAARFARNSRQAQGDGGHRVTTRSTRPFRFGSEDRPDPDPALAPGTLVGGRYRIAGLLGEGGMGRVYEAEHTVLQRRVALKLLRRDAEAAAENLARFQREALAASRIGAPQIVEIVDFDHHVGEAGSPQTYMVMERLVGESFEDWMAVERGLDEGLELLAQLCDGLAAAHRAGVIHRDIKPANVFCCAPDPTNPSARSRVKILDFGIAKITAGGEGYQTQRGTLLGTPYYLAPERAMGEQLSAAADIYSVGVILYELLTGNVPFVAESFMGILARHVRDQPLDPRQAVPGRQIPDSVAALCMRLLAKEPGARPSAEALAGELRELLAKERAQLAAVRVGAEHELAGPGDDTQVFDDPSEPRLAERDTLAPGAAGSSSTSSVSNSAAATVELAIAPADEAARGRSNTAIGHASAAMSATTGSVGRAAVEPEPHAENRLGLVIGLVAGALVLVGGLTLALTRVNREPAGADEAAVEVADEDASLPAGSESELESNASAEAAAGSDGPVHAPETKDAAQASQTGETGEPAEEAVEPTPEPKAAKTPREPSKGKSKPKPKPEAKPEPEANPEPEAKPDPPAPDPADSQLPTIKDDVYD